MYIFYSPLSHFLVLCVILVCYIAQRDRIHFISMFLCEETNSTGRIIFNGYFKSYFVVFVWTCKVFFGGGGLLNQRQTCKLACNVASHRSHTKSAVMYCVQAHVSKIKFDCSVCYCRTFSGVSALNTF